MENPILKIVLPHEIISLGKSISYLSLSKTNLEREAFKQYSMNVANSLSILFTRFFINKNIKSYLFIETLLGLRPQ
jgi:hypothetical protein